MRALKCNIAIDTNLLDQGIRLGLKDDREKTSSVTNQMALFQVTSLHSLISWAMRLLSEQLRAL